MRNRIETGTIRSPATRRILAYRSARSCLSTQTIACYCRPKPAFFVLYAVASDDGSTTSVSPPAPDAEEPVGGSKLKTRPHKESGEFCDSRAMDDSSTSLP
jgi:hypothetical protein